MKFVWNCIPQKLRAIIIDTSRNIMYLMTVQGVSSILYGFMRMEAKWSTFSTEFQNIVINSCIEHFSKKSINAQNISNTVYSLGVMGAKRDKFPENFRNSLMKCINDFVAFNNQELSNTIYGLAILEADW